MLQIDPAQRARPTTGRTVTPIRTAVAVTQQSSAAIATGRSVVVRGFAGILLGDRRRALHDVIAGTAVIYSWDARAARLRFLSRG